MKRWSKILLLLITLGLAGAVPLTLWYSQKETQIRSGAAEYDGYDVFCTEDTSNTRILSVTDPVEFFDQQKGEYKISWSVKNTSTEPLTLHAEQYGCRCAEPNAQTTPAELLTADSAYPGRLCVGGWPTTTTGNPPTALEVTTPWNYCSYAYTANAEALDEDATTRAQKQQRAQQTSGQQGPPLVLQPGESKAMESVVGTQNAEVNYCGSFQTTWNILKVERTSGTCTIRKTPGQFLATIGVIITGDGSGGYESWRPDGVSAVGGACVARTTPPPTGTFKNCKNGACVLDPTAQRDMCTQDAQCNVSVCSGATPGAHACESTPIEEVTSGARTCASDGECFVKQVCRGDNTGNNSCELEWGTPTAGETTCTPETAATVCNKTYSVCEDKQCVEKFGDKLSTCSANADCSAVCYQKTCETESALQGRGISTTGLVSCANASVGTQPVECAQNICVGNACTPTAVELIPKDGSAVYCSSNAVCTAPAAHCEGVSCVSGAPTGSQKACSAVGTNDPLCQPTTTNQFKKCVGFSCVLSADPALTQDACQNNDQCIPRYAVCDGQACVEKIGTKPTAEQATQQNLTFCTTPGSNECVPPPPPTGVSGILPVMLVVLLGGALLGIRLLL